MDEQFNLPFEPQHRYAGFWIRFVAVCIDGLVLQAVMFLIRFITNSSLLHPPFWLTVLQYFIYWIYAVVLTVLFGQTLGKMALGIRVIRSNGHANSWGVMMLREIIGKFVSSLILGIGYVMAGFDSQKRALHDRMSGTVVVKVK